jgi:hypothetical protein
MYDSQKDQINSLKIIIIRFVQDCIEVINKTYLNL